MGGLFYWVLNLSILGSGAGLLLLLLRRVRKFPRFGIYLLWLLPLFRLWMPVGPANRYSLLSLLSRFTTKTLVVWQDVPWITTTNSVMAANGHFPITYKNGFLKDVFAVCGTVWVIVAAGAVLCSALLYFSAKRTLKDAAHIKDNIYQSDKIAAPAVYGVIRPKIILPPALADADLDYILLHERLHIRRRDNLWRAVAVVSACVHWFNPLVWIFLQAFFADMELACDAGVLKNLNRDGQKAYAAALLACCAGASPYASAFGGAKTKRRIDGILSYKKLTLGSGLCAAAFLLWFAVTVATNASG